MRKPLLAAAALCAVAILATRDPALRKRLERFRAKQDAEVRAIKLPPPKTK